VYNIIIIIELVHIRSYTHGNGDVPPTFDKITNQEPIMVTEKSNKLKGSGWRKISDPKDLEKSLVTMLNRILMSDDSLSHCGKFANLSHAWIACRRLRLDIEEVRDLRQRLEKIEQEAAK